MAAPAYRAPLTEMQLALELFDLKSDFAMPVLQEAAKFAEHKLSPLNQKHDQIGAKHHADGKVTTPDGMKQLYQNFRENGWNSAGFSEELGGMGLPRSLSALVAEMWHGSHMSFGLCPMLTQSAIELLAEHGTDQQKADYLPRLISGVWTGTMCMTEPQAGSDIGLVRTTAAKQGDHYLISGTKIYITFGEHDLTENIIHIVLARLDNAPEGVKGLSLFIVPKMLNSGTRNDVTCVSIEEKMGIHASPTCVMGFGENEGAIGYLLGGEHQGIRTMFTMMNAARFAVGLQGLGVLRYAYQLAHDYANERIQGRGKALANHPDIQRMLLGLQSHDLALRLMAVHYTDAQMRNDSDRVDLLTPIVKAHMTHLAFDGCSDAMQIFGGMGYVEDTGIAQLLRDSRIAMIYEGTNGIQALDLSFRKLIIQSGAAIKALQSDMWETAMAASSGQSQLQREAGALLHQLIESLDKAVIHQQQCVSDNTDETIKAAQLAANDMLHCLGLTIEGWLLTKALPLVEKDNRYQHLQPAIGFFIHHLMPDAISKAERIQRAYKVIEYLK